MPRFVTEFRCFLISPSDVAAERDVLTDATRKWNAQVGVRLRFRIELVRWETHGVPDLSDSPQGIINKQILEDCDLGVAIFWSRLGTATSHYASGSLEEIERLRKAGRRIIVYFCDRPVPQDRLRDTQFHDLATFRDRISREGLVGRYTSEAELAEHYFLNLTNILTSAGAAAGVTAKEHAADGTAEDDPVVPYDFKEDFARSVAHVELARRGYHPLRLDPRHSNEKTTNSYIRDFMTGGSEDIFLVILGEPYFREPPEFYVPKELIHLSSENYFYIFVRMIALYQRPLYYIVPSKIVHQRVAKEPGAPRYFTFDGVTQDLTDMWHFNDAAGEFLEAWHLLGPPPPSKE